ILAQLDLARRLQPYLSQHSLHALPALRRAIAVEPPKIIQYLGGRQVVVKIWLLRQVADVAVHADVAYRFPEDARAARCRKDNPHQQLDGRSLSRPVGTEQAKDFAFLHLHRQAFERRLPFQVEKSVRIFFAEIFCLNRKRGHDLFLQACSRRQRALRDVVRQTATWPLVVPYFPICTSSLAGAGAGAIGTGLSVCGSRQLSRIPTCCTQETVHRGPQNLSVRYSRWRISGV